MTGKLDYNEVFQFMKDFGINVLNQFEELIIDVKTNTYATISDCKDIEDVKTKVVFNLCRPIGKGLEKKDADRLLEKFNRYFKVELTKEDMRLMYGELCFMNKLADFKSFIQRGFPMSELRGAG
ncbi:hypothetical protein [Sporosarcina psychrophila]|uniref:Uncharacterized protein n=1 Tax=Sporosarcina psychrophila TaxID=1476 RepID=A0ABV2KAG6_SPOPS